MVFSVVVMIVVCCCCFLLSCSLFSSYVVMTPSPPPKKKKNKEKTEGPKSGTTSGQYQIGQLCLQFLKLSCFCFLFLVFVGVFSENTIKRVSSQFWALFFLGSKSRVNKWSTIWSISGPH